MGNLLCDYRARIGLFRTCFYVRSPTKSFVLNCCTISVSLFLANCYFIMYVLVMLLIVSGDVKPNPGPGNDINHFSVMHANVRSLASEPKLIDMNVRATEHKLSVLGVSETWLDDTIRDSDLEIPGYNIIRKDRNRHGGGVAIYVEDNLYFKVHPELSSNSFETLWISVRLPQGRVYVGVMYVSPNLSTSAADHFIDYLEVTFDSINTNNPKAIILLGDFNAKSNKWFSKQQDNPLGTKLYDFTKRYNLGQVIQNPTRVTNLSASLIDLIITDNENRVVKSETGLPILGSDHSTISATFTFKMQSTSYIREVYDLEKTNMETLKNALTTFDWNSCLNGENAQSNVDNWINNLEVLIKDNVYCSRIRIRSRDKPWFKNNLKHLINNRHRLYKRAKLTNSAEAWEIYKESENLCRNAFKQARMDYYNSLVNDLSDETSTPKKWWSVINSLTGNKRKESIPPLQKPDGQTVFSDFEKCQLFNEYFIEQTQLNDTNVEVPPVTKLTDARISNMLFEISDVRKEFEKLNVSKATGPDGISNKIIRNIFPCIAGPICELFNYSISNGVYPTQWKRSHVIPIHKQGDKSLVKNYRPVSLLCCISKVLEKLVSNKLMAFLLENNLISERQAGFMPKDSTCNQLIRISDYILEAFEKGQDVIAVFMDISKAFDKVWTKGLLVKLENNGINGNLLKWFASYLTHRSQKVVLNGQCSQALSIGAGVPQGSVLGPILFLIYINDISEVNLCPTNLFADDASLMESNSDFMLTVEKVSNDLVNIERWGKKWLVSFNLIKTVFMIFTCKNELPNVPRLMFCGKPLTLVESHCHLGVTFTRNMSWNQHIDNVIDKVNKRLYFLTKLSRLVPRKTLVMVYNSMILSVIDYGCQVYGGLKAFEVNKLEQLQYRAGLIITGALKTSSYLKVLNELGWPTLSERRAYFNACLMFKIVNGLSPIYLQNLILNIRPPLDVRMNLRNADHLAVPRTRLKITELNFKTSSIKLRNNLPRSIRNCSTIASFKYNYKKQFFPKVRHELGVGNTRAVQLLTRFRLDFTTLNIDLERRGIVSSKACTCGSQIESYCHFFLECTKYNGIRQQLYEGLANILNTNLDNILRMTKKTCLNLLLNGLVGDYSKTVRILNLSQTYLTLSKRF